MPPVPNEIYAFPFSVGPSDVQNFPGAKLRDWFAIEALKGILSCEPDGHKLFERGDAPRTKLQDFRAQLAYDYADAMMRAGGYTT